MAIKNLFISFKDLFVSLGKQSFYLYRKFCKVEIPKGITYLNTLKRKIQNLYDTNLELGLFHLYNNNLWDSYFRFSFMRYIFRNIENTKKEEIYFNLFKILVIQNKKKKAKEFLKKIKTEINKGNSTFYSRQDVLFYERILYCIDNIEGVEQSILMNKFDIMAPYYVENYIIPKNYAGHEIVAKYITKYLDKFDINKKNLKILDLCCGTGIVPQFLKMNNIGGYFVGVDFSENMIEISTHIKSNSKKVFNTLYCNDMIDFTKKLNTINNKNISSTVDNRESTIHQTFDIVLAIDCLHYYGNFSQQLSAIKTTLYNTRSILIVTVLANNDSNSCKYENNVEHKFSYSKDFLYDIFTHKGFYILDIEKVEFFKNCYYWCIVCQKKA